MHTCDKFQKGIREIFLSFQGGLSKKHTIYRKNLNSDEGDFEIAVKSIMFEKQFSGSLPEDQGEFTSVHLNELCWAPSPQCYIPSPKVIGPLVLVKIFKGFLPYMGMAAILVT